MFRLHPAALDLCPHTIIAVGRPQHGALRDRSSRVDVSSPVQGASRKIGVAPDAILGEFARSVAFHGARRWVPDLCPRPDGLRGQRDSVRDGWVKEHDKGGGGTAGTPIRVPTCQFVHLTGPRLRTGGRLAFEPFSGHCCLPVSEEGSFISCASHGERRPGRARGRLASTGRLQVLYAQPHRGPPGARNEPYHREKSRPTEPLLPLEVIDLTLEGVVDL